MLLSNFWDEHRMLSPVLEAGFRHQLALNIPRVTRANAEAILLGHSYRFRWQLSQGLECKAH